MCRITGFWDFTYQQNYPLAATLTAMRDTLQHGGPDSEGIFCHPRQPLALGHRRLSILDLSEAGHQPMTWKHWVIVYNGEIYNFHAIRQQLQAEGITFSTGTDTEVILKAFEQWGMDMVQHFRGMFAFAIWDNRQQQLTLCRDRVGVKPLYWYWKDGLFMFASELKAFHQHPHFDKTISQDAVSLYLQQGYIHQPHCIFEYAHKLTGGSYLVIDAQQQIRTQTYWDAQQIYTQASPSTQSEGELLEELEAILTESFELRMVADVPVGAFLSGGIDSSTVTALLQKQNHQLKTFTIGFEDEEYNEAQHAKAVAQHLGTDHHELICTESDFERIIPRLPELYDEPFGDSSGIPTFLVAQMAKEHVKVSLSADGGDEIFGGYTKYEITHNFYPKIQSLPSFVRKSLRGLSKTVDPLWLERYSRYIPMLNKYKNISNKLPKLQNALAAKDALTFFNIASTYITEADQRKLFPHYCPRFATEQSPDLQKRIGFWGMIDIKTFLEGDIMTKVDRATMAVALEGRDPFLDHKIIEFGMRLPDAYKIKGHSTKYLLRQLLFKHVPQELIERPKQGFSIPVQKWLLHSLQKDLRAIPHDKDFVTTFDFDQTALATTINNFLDQRQYINPHFIWFLYNLHQWYLRWVL